MLSGYVSKRGLFISKSDRGFRATFNVTEFSFLVVLFDKARASAGSCSRRSRPVPKDSLFRDDIFDKACRKLLNYLRV